MKVRTNPKDAAAFRARVLQLLRYDAEAGRFYWKHTRGPLAQAGEEAGTVCPLGYRKIKIEGSLYMAHRLVWLVEHGRWPRKMVDHRDRISGNNRIQNLRECVSSENQQNRKCGSHNKTGCIGVYPRKGKNKFIVSICVRKKRFYIGDFFSIEDAKAAYAEAKRRLHLFHSEVP